MKAGFILIFCLLFFAVSLAQVPYSTKSKKAIKHYEKAEVLLKQRRVNEAIREFNEALQKDQDFIEAH